MEANIARLVEALAHDAVSLEVAPSTENASPIRRVCQAYATIDYGMEDDVGSSVVCLGIVGVNREMLRRAEAVNTAKARFKAICAPLYRIRMRIPVKGESSPTRAIPVMRVILRSLQRSDLNLLAAYRKLPILQAPPATVTYTRAHTRSVYRKSIDELHAVLNNLEGAKVARDRARLESLGRRETHLALVKERYQNIRANVLYTHLDPRGRGRVQISAELPLLYAKGRGTPAPLVTFPGSDNASNQPSRQRQPKLEPEPYLESIPAYRYRAGP